MADPDIIGAYGGGQYGVPDPPYGRELDPAPLPPAPPINWSYELAGSYAGNALAWPQSPSSEGRPYTDFVGGGEDFLVVTTDGSAIEGFTVQWPHATAQWGFEPTDLEVFPAVHESFEWYMAQLEFSLDDLAAGPLETFTAAGWTLSSQAAFAPTDLEVLHLSATAPLYADSFEIGEWNVMNSLDPLVVIVPVIATFDGGGFEDPCSDWDLELVW